MDRLTKKNDSGGYYYQKCFEKCNGLGASSKCNNCEITTSVCEKVGKYEDLEEQGLLLRLPCKVGSTLYQPISNQINEYKAIGLCFDITRNEFMYEVAYQIGLQWYKTTCDFDCINKTVFLTQAEAEQKLKEMESD